MSEWVVVLETVLESILPPESHLVRVEYFGLCLVRVASWIAAFVQKTRMIHEVTRTHKLVATEIDF